MKPPRQQVSFPDVAIIKKGTPKQVVQRDGKEMKIQGKDLGQKFRIHFLPGTEDVRAAWNNRHASEYVKYGDKFAIPDGYECTSLVAVLPSLSVWDSFEYVNATYDAAGRRMGVANDDHYITKRDPLTGEYLIRDGQPYEKFTPGDVIAYERKGQHYELKMKTDGRLRLVLKDLVEQGILVQCILKTSSFYDCQNIKRQLAGIQTIADMVNRGNAGGIPIILYRSQSDCVWNKPDGSAARVKQWFVNIKADPEWVKHAFARLGQNALVAPLEQNLLPAPEVQGSVSPESEDFSDSDGEPGAEEEFINVVATEVPTDTQQPQTTGPTITHNCMNAQVVQLVAETAKVSTADAAKWLAVAKQEGRIPAMITLEQATEFAKHLNV